MNPAHQDPFTNRLPGQRLKFIFILFKYPLHLLTTFEAILHIIFPVQEREGEGVSIAVTTLWMLFWGFYVIRPISVNLHKT